MIRLVKTLTEGYPGDSSDSPTDPVGFGVGHRSRAYTQFAVNGDGSFSPDGVTTPSLKPGIYKLSEDMSGKPIYTPHRLDSDKLIRFEDERFNRVLNEIANFWEIKSRFEEIGLIHKRGVLLFGEPGTGKSALLKLVMEDVIKRQHTVFLGRSPDLLQKAMTCFRQVEPERPTLAILEDMDELASYNEHAILNLFDGDSTVSNVLYLGTTNYLNRLTPRLLRPGRFDTKVEIGNPPIQGRIAYFEQKLGNLVDQQKIQTLAEITDNFSFAQLREFLVCFYAYGDDPEKAANKVRNGGYDTVPDMEPTSEEMNANHGMIQKLRSWKAVESKIRDKSVRRLMEAMRKV